MTESTVKFDGKIKLEDGTYLIINKEKVNAIDLTKVTEIQGSFVGALMYLKNMKNVKIIISEYVYNILKIQGVYDFLEKNIIYMED